MYDLRHEIRFVDASAYPIAHGCSPDAFLKLVHIDDPAELTPFFKALEKLSEEHSCNFLVSVSMEQEKLPQELHAYAQ